MCTYLQEKFPEVRLLGQKINTYVILLGFDKFPSLRIVPIYIPTSTLWECLFSHSLTKSMSCHTFQLLLICCYFSVFLSLCFMILTNILYFRAMLISFLVNYLFMCFSNFLSSFDLFFTSVFKISLYLRRLCIYKYFASSFSVVLWLVLWLLLLLFLTIKNK